VIRPSSVGSRNAIRSRPTPWVRPWTVSSSRAVRSSASSGHSTRARWGGGLFEFRFQDLTEDLLRQLGKKARRKLLEAQQKVLFRVFFHPHGDNVLLLLGGYDKAKHSSPTYQNAQIQIARKRLADWQARHRQRRK